MHTRANINAGREIRCRVRASTLAQPLLVRSPFSFFYPRISALSLRFCRVVLSRTPLSGPPCKSPRLHAVPPRCFSDVLLSRARIPRGRKTRLYFYVGFNRGFAGIFETISSPNAAPVSITSAHSRRVEDRLVVTSHPLALRLL